MTTTTTRASVAPVPEARTRRGARRYAAVALRIALSYGGLLVGAAFFALPFLWMVRSSFMNDAQIFAIPMRVLPDPFHWRNYRDFWEILPFNLFFVNTLTVSTVSTLGAVFTSSLAAYAFARFRFRGRDKLFLLVLATMMLPIHVTLLPTFILFKSLGWIDTLLPLIIPHLFGGAFYIFLLRQFFLTLPLELDDAARIDGASSLQILWHIIYPLSIPALATVALFSFLGHWNEFLLPLIYINSLEKMTLAIGLQFFRQQSGTPWGMLMAASTFVVAPIVIVFFLTQRTFIRGIALTGIKG